MEQTAEIPRLRRVPRQERSRLRLRRVLDAADRVAAKEGAEALSTQRVAEVAGVSIGSLYQYLPDKEAIVEALAQRYLAEFTALMDELVERGAEVPFDDPVGTVIDAFAARYRERPGYRALWFGRELTAELRAADREQKAGLAAGLLRLLVALGLVGETPESEVAARAGVLVADALLQEAFRSDEPALVEEAKRILRLYLDDVAATGASARKRG